MITVVEPAHFGATHIQVNSAFLALIAQHYLNEKIEIWAEDDHAQLLKHKLTSNPNICFKTFPNYNNDKAFFWLRKIIGEWIQIFKVVRNTKNSGVVFWLSIFPTGHFVLYLLNTFIYKNCKHIVVLHGELEYLSKSNGIGELFFKKILKIAIASKYSKLKYLVLGHNIKSQLLSLFPYKKADIEVVPHPFLYDDYKTPLLKNGPIKIVVFGALNKSKNAHLIFELAKRFTEDIIANKVQFSTLGKLNHDIDSYKNEWVNCYKPNLFINHQELIEHLAQHHLSIFFYSKDNYRFTASGAIHESINSGIPFLAFPNDYFKCSFVTYKLGIFVDTLDEMEAYIRSLMHQDSIILSHQQQEIMRFVQQNSFLLQSQNFNNALESLKVSGKKFLND